MPEHRTHSTYKVPIGSVVILLGKNTFKTTFSIDGSKIVRVDIRQKDFLTCILEKGQFAEKYLDCSSKKVCYVYF